MLTIKTGRNATLYIALVLAFSLAPESQAKNNVEVVSGKGESLEVRDSLFGSKLKVQDRFGNKVESGSGWFGTSKKEVKVLGNSFETKKGILGGKSYKATSILGDKIETKRTWFGLGPRKTTVDLSGVTSVAGSLLKSKKTDAKPALKAPETTASQADSANWQ